MQRKLTITVDDEVYRGLHRQIGRGSISRFIENLVRPHVVDSVNLEEEYREATRDQKAEHEADAWIEANPDDALRPPIFLPLNKPSGSSLVCP